MSNHLAAFKYLILEPADRDVLHGSIPKCRQAKDGMSIREHGAWASARTWYANSSILRPHFKQNQHSFWAAHMQVQKAASQDQSIKATANSKTELVKPLNTIDIKVYSCACCGHHPSGPLQLMTMAQVSWLPGWLMSVILAVVQDLSWDDRERVLRLLFVKINSSTRQELPTHQLSTQLGTSSTGALQLHGSRAGAKQTAIV